MHPDLASLSNYESVEVAWDYCLQENICLVDIGLTINPYLSIPNLMFSNMNRCSAGLMGANSYSGHSNNSLSRSYTDDRERIYDFYCLAVKSESAAISRVR